MVRRLARHLTNNERNPVTIIGTPDYHLRQGKQERGYNSMGLGSGNKKPLSLFLNLMVYYVIFY